MADKQVTQKVVTAIHVDRLTIETVGGEPTCIATYRVRDAAGSIIGNHRSVEIPLAPGVVTTLKAFVTNTVVPAINAAEGT